MRVAAVMKPVREDKKRLDSSLALLEAASRRGWQVFIVFPQNIFFREGKVWAHLQEAHMTQDEQVYVADDETITCELSSLDAILLRTDPPVDPQYVSVCQLLGLAVLQGALIVNDPSTIVLKNEKLFSQEFSEYVPPTLVTSQKAQIREFVRGCKDAVIKPMNGMGGRGVFRLRWQALNVETIVEALTEDGKCNVVVQQTIKNFRLGDRRILLVEGEPVPYVLLRVPTANSFRANMAAGGDIEGVRMNDRDKEICSFLGPQLQRWGVFLAGIDIVGGMLTEINITSPTGIRELDRFFDTDIGSRCMDALEGKIIKNTPILRT